MSKSFEFFFDYVSPTAYLGYFEAQRVAERTGADLIFRPMFLGGVMQATGNQPPGMVAAKGKYMGRDLERCAARVGVALNFNPHFPMNTLPLTRATVGLEHDPQTRQRFMEACWHTMWGKDGPLNPTEPDTLQKIAAAADIDVDTLSKLASDPANKETLKQNTAEAVSRGAFGAPTFFVGEEMFFGHDRLDYVEEMLN